MGTLPYCRPGGWEKNIMHAVTKGPTLRQPHSHVQASLAVAVGRLSMHGDAGPEVSKV